MLSSACCQQTREHNFQSTVNCSLSFLVLVDRTEIYLIAGLAMDEVQCVPRVQMAFYLPLEITNRAFTDTLLNPASNAYQTLYKEVTDLVR